MDNAKSAGSVLHRPYAEITLYGVLFLFFFQLLTDFVEAIYAFGLLGTSIPPELAFVLLLFTPLLLIPFRRALPGRSTPVFALLVILCRLIEVTLDTRGRMIVAGIGVGAFLLYFPVLLWLQSRRRYVNMGAGIGAGLAFGVGMSVMFRAVKSGTDVTTSGDLQPLAWLLAAAAAFLLFRDFGPQPYRPDAQGDQAVEPRQGRMLVILSLGLVSAVSLLYLAFVAPNVIARWTGTSYLLILGVEMLALLGLAYVMAQPGMLALLSRPGVLIFLNLLFVISLISTILAHQVSFPLDSTRYPLAEPDVTSLLYVPLLVMMLSFPIILVDFVLFLRGMLAMRPTPRALSAAFALSSLFLLVIILAHVFTTVYAYIPVVGPYFRDRFWLVYLVPGVVLMLPFLSSRAGQWGLPAVTAGRFPFVMLLIGIVAVGGAILASGRPPAPVANQATLRVLTYNILQGYSESGLRNYDGQLDLIRQANADVIGLQESDTNRIAGGNADLVRYFSDQLELHSYYGPKTVPGTFGIALLSRFPIENARTFYMYSEGEQTATISAQITIEDRMFNVFVTHLGNGGPIVQQEAILREVVGKDDVILMGDFNFRPDSQQYRLTTESLVDSWLKKWPDGRDDRGLDPRNRIDHIFVSPGLAVSDALVFDSPQSDHPAVLAEISLDD